MPLPPALASASDSSTQSKVIHSVLHNELCKGLSTAPVVSLRCRTHGLGLSSGPNSIGTSEDKGSQTSSYDSVAISGSTRGFSSHANDMGLQVLRTARQRPAPTDRRRSRDALLDTLHGEALPRLVHTLAKSRDSAVYRGECRGVQLAIKTRLLSVLEVSQVLCESTAAFGVRHPNLVYTYSHHLQKTDTPASWDGGSHKLCLVQEYCNGGSLRRAIDRGHLSPRRLRNRRWAPVMGLLVDIAASMSLMHSQHLYHGALEPSHVMLAFDETVCPSVKRALAYEAAVAKVKGFGEALRTDMAGWPGACTNGAVFFVAPEAKAHHQPSRAADVYAFGVMMWELMRGEPVFAQRQAPSAQGPHDKQAGGGGEAPLELSPDYPNLPDNVPLSYTLLMRACLSKNPTERPSFRQILVLIGDVLTEVAKGRYRNSLGAQVTASDTIMVP